MLFLALVSMLVSTKSFAQYYYNPYNMYYNYGISSQVLYDPCVQASIRVAQSSNRILNQGYQMQMEMINNGYYNNNTYQNTSTNNNSQSNKSTHVKCDNCNGRGYNTKHLWMGGDRISRVKINCAFCNGSGKVRQ